MRSKNLGEVKVKEENECIEEEGDKGGVLIREGQVQVELAREFF